MHCEAAVIQWGTETYGNTEEEHLNQAWVLDKQRREVRRKKSVLPTERTKYTRGIETTDYK